jgi:hypothetical protein
VAAKADTDADAGCDDDGVVVRGEGGRSAVVKEPRREVTDAVFVVTAAFGERSIDLGVSAAADSGSSNGSIMRFARTAASPPEIAREGLDPPAPSKIGVPAMLWC